MTRSATGLSAAAFQVAGAFADPEAGRPVWTSPTTPPVGALTAALNALAGAAYTWRTTGPTSVIGRAGAVTGINYLRMLVQQWQQALLRRLGVADPTDALGVVVTGWSLVNVITGGRLLTTPG